MGYIIGGKPQLITKFSDSDFKNAAVNQERQIIQVPTITPKRVYGGLNKKSALTDVTRTAPLFNDPRYTSSTLAIPTDERTLHGLYRFFNETDPIVGCLPAGELILTDNGVKPIEEITPLVDMVIDSKGQFQQVTDLIKSKTKKQMYTVYVKSCLPMKLTGNHKVLVKSSEHHNFGNSHFRWVLTDAPPAWKPAADLKVRDYVMYPKYTVIKEPPVLDLAMYLSTHSKAGQEIYTITKDKIYRKGNVKRVFPRFIKVNEEFAELAGWYIAEGSTGKMTGGLEFCLHKKETKEAKRIIYLIKKIFNVDAYISPSKKTLGMEVMVGSQLVAKMFAWEFGHYSYLKKVPQYMLDAPIPLVKALLKAYIAGDGHHSKYDVEFVTVSSTLSLQLTLLATKLGIYFRNHCSDYSAHGGLLEWYSAAPKFVVYPKLYDKPFKQKKKEALACIEDDNYFYLPISKIKHRKFTGTVYDITTKDHSFLYRGIVHNSALRLHSEMPLSDLKLGQCEDSGVQQHYEEQWDRINGLKLLTDIVSEYYEIGTTVPFGAWNEADYMWDQFAILNPDYVKIESTWINQNPLVKLVPDDALKRIVRTQSPQYLYKQIPPEIVRYVMFNQEIPLEPNNVFVLAHARRPYEAKGRSIIKRILKVLMLEDRYNQANFALATRHMVPMTIVKCGDAQSGWTPDDAELDSVREAMAAYELDPNFTLIWHYAIDVQFYGANGKTLPVGPELDRIYKLKFIGLNVHEQLLAGGGGSYSAAYVNLEVQRQRYLNLQLKLENFIHQGVFKPVADLCGFYRIKQAISGPARTSSMKYGDTDTVMKDIMKQYTKLRDFQDNAEFKTFLTRKAVEYQNQTQKEMREYVYPKLDWGGMSASTDENLKNYVKWLRKEAPHLVDDATLARLARLDRDTQEKAYMKDLERDQERMINVSKAGLLPFMQKRQGKGAGGGGAMDFGGIGDIGVGGGPEEGAGPGMEGGGEPNLPTGVGGPPETAQGGVPAPAGMPQAALELGPGIRKATTQDDLFITGENKELLKAKSAEDIALVQVVNG